MTAAMERGDLEEAARQGALAGPAVVERALGSPNRATVLAGIAAAPSTDDRAELLAPLAHLAAGADRRVAIPAAHAARAIAASLGRRDLPDDLAPADLAEGAVAWRELALRRDRWIEVRADALAVAAALTHVTAPGALGFDAGIMFTDPDPAVRAAGLALVPTPAPPDARAALVAVVTSDAVSRNALAAAQALCAELSLDPRGHSRALLAAGGPTPSTESPRDALADLGAAGIAAIRALVLEPTASPPAVRDAARCLAAESSPESAATLAKLKGKL